MRTRFRRLIGVLIALSCACIVDTSPVRADDAAPADSTTVVVVGDGSIRDILLSKNDETDNIATGSLAAVISRGRQWSATFRVRLAQEDTTRIRIGPTILTPAWGTGLSVEGKVSLNEAMNRGLSGYFALSRSVWSDSLDAFSADVLALGIGTHVDVVDTGDDDNRFSLTASAGAGVRWILGDVADSGLDAFRASMLNTTKRFFLGPELSVRASANFVSFSWLFAYYPNDGGKVARGFSGGQQTVALTIEAPIWQF